MFRRNSRPNLIRYICQLSLQHYEKRKTFSLTNVKASSLIIINLYLWGGRGVKYFFPSGCAFDRKMIQSSVVIMEEKVKSERWHPFQYRCAQIII